MRTRICNQCQGTRRVIVDEIETTPTPGNRVFRSFRRVFGGPCSSCRGTGLTRTPGKKQPRAA
jgi:hypothetical protein